MKIGHSRFLAFVLALAMLPGVAEIVESATHLVTEGHLAHAAPAGDRHEPTEPEHVCTPIFHLCGCHASLPFLGPQSPPKMTLGASLIGDAPEPVVPPSGFWPAIDPPPRT